METIRTFLPLAVAFGLYLAAVYRTSKKWLWGRCLGASVISFGLLFIFLPQLGRWLKPNLAAENLRLLLVFGLFYVPVLSLINRKVLKIKFWPTAAGSLAVYLGYVFCWFLREYLM